ncbi:MAG: transposase family protein, partial [Dactylosporangium sp.]|nr:transposase family protein [Dactylosporangium sp.]NNJ61099.1 transposase family protein [Dactylosporangium sp.]
MIFPQLAGIVIDRVWARPTTVRIDAHGRTIEQPCRTCGQPCRTCGQPSSRGHSHYTRRIADADIGGKHLVIHMQVRRLWCDNPECPAKTFSEQLPELAPRYARRSPPTDRAMADIGLALAGRAGSRLATRLG